jgi:hypothetical protein
MKKILGKVAKLLGGVVLALALVVGGYVILRPKPPQPPETVADLAEAEAYLEDLVRHSRDSLPGLVSHQDPHRDGHSPAPRAKPAAYRRSSGRLLAVL